MTINTPRGGSRNGSLVERTYHCVSLQRPGEQRGGYGKWWNKATQDHRKPVVFKSHVGESANTKESAKYQPKALPGVSGGQLPGCNEKRSVVVKRFEKQNGLLTEKRTA